MLARILSIEFTQTAIRVALFASSAALVVAWAERAQAEERSAGAVAYNWNGFYAGGQMGYTFGVSRWTASSPGATDVSGSLSFTQRIGPFSESGSFFAGLQGGYNYMLPNRLVIGGEADATFPTFPDRNGISTGGTTNLTSPTLGPETYSETVLASGTLRGRIGYAISDKRRPSWRKKRILNSLTWARHPARTIKSRPEFGMCGAIHLVLI